MDKNLTCMDCHKTGTDVYMTTTPDRRDFKQFPRCNDCFERRLASARQTMNRYPEAFIGPDPFEEGGW